MKKWFNWLSILAISLAAGSLLDASYNIVRFTNKSYMLGPGFWAGRQSATFSKAAPFIPAQLPGPMDTWAGGGRKRIELEAPYKRDFVMKLRLLESHDAYPPTIAILAGGKEICRILIKKGSGKSDNAWQNDGTRSDYSATIPAEAVRGAGDNVAIESLDGSWIAIDDVVFYPSARWWEVWRIIPVNIAYWLLWGCFGALAIVYIWSAVSAGIAWSLAANATLTAVSIGATLAMAEIGLRYFLPQPEYENTLRMVFDADPNVGYRLKPNVKTALGFDTNRFGMRDYDRYTKKKPPGVFRILCLGDSFTYSLTAMEDSYPKVLERLLAGGSKKVETLNAGGNGYGTRDEYKYFKAYGLDLEPDLVLVGFFVGNDITDNEPGRWITAVNGTMVGLDTAKAMSAERISWEKWKRQFLTQFHLYRLVTSRDYGDLFKKHAAEAKKLRRDMNVKTGELCISVGTAVSFRDPKVFDATLQGCWANTIEQLDNVTRLAKENNIALGIILIPAEIQFDTGEAMLIGQERKKVDPDLDLAYPQKALMELAKEHGWPMLDTLDEMKKRGKGKRLYYCHDTHFNEEGNRIIGEVIRDWVGERFGGEIGLPAGKR